MEKAYFHFVGVVPFHALAWNGSLYWSCYGGRL